MIAMLKPHGQRRENDGALNGQTFCQYLPTLHWIRCKPNISQIDVRVQCSVFGRGSPNQAELPSCVRFLRGHASDQVAKF